MVFWLVYTQRYHLFSCKKWNLLRGMIFALWKKQSLKFAWKNELIKKPMTGKAVVEKKKVQKNRLNFFVVFTAAVNVVVLIVRHYGDTSGTRRGRGEGPRERRHQPRGTVAIAPVRFVPVRSRKVAGCGNCRLFHNKTINSISIFFVYLQLSVFYFQKRWKIYFFHCLFQ